MSPTFVSDLFSDRSETVSDLFSARSETNGPPLKVIAKPDLKSNLRLLLALKRSYVQQQCWLSFGTCAIKGMSAIADG